MIRKVSVQTATILALLLIAPTVLIAAVSFAPSVEAQQSYSAWMKIVTSGWKGVDVAGNKGTADSAPRDADAKAVFPDPEYTGFADRYNVTNVCVELYQFKSLGFDGPVNAGAPNGTGFIKITWPASWNNLTVVVKAKSYQGECITGGSPFKGLIVYWLTVNPYSAWLAAHVAGTGISADGNYTINDDGTVDAHLSTDFDFNSATDGATGYLGSGPVDFWDGPTMGPKDFSAIYSTASTAFLARAAYIFKVFHVHTWYGTDDVLSYAPIYIFDLNHTKADDDASMIQAAITSRTGDGQSRFNRGIFPTSQGVGDGRYAENPLVPIPLQTWNIQTGIPYWHDEELGEGIGRPHLNATARVYWETVEVNQTVYVGTGWHGRWVWDPFADKYETGLTGPLAITHNYTYPITYDGTLTEGLRPVANFLNSTVFYARFCTQDADLKIQHPEVGDKLVGAEVTINLKTVATVQPYYLSHNILTTDAGGCTDDPHKWPGYLKGQTEALEEGPGGEPFATVVRPDFSKFARFPNGTHFMDVKIDDVNGFWYAANISVHYDPRDDKSPASGYFERAWGGSADGPWNNAGKNYSALVPLVDYVKTRTYKDDPLYDGFDVQVKWKGGSRNNYGGVAVLVDSVRVPNPYAIADLWDYQNKDLFGAWVFPESKLANNKLLLMVKSADAVSITYDTDTGPVTATISDPHPTLFEVMGSYDFAINNFDPTSGTYDVSIFAAAGSHLAVNNATDGGDIVDAWNVTRIMISNSLTAIKKHDIFPGGVHVAFAQAQGQADFQADGTDELTSVEHVMVSGGPLELEVWPGPPGSGTIRVLLSMQDNNIVFQTGQHGPQVYSDYTGTLLLKGPPITFSTQGMVGLKGTGQIAFSYDTTVDVQLLSLFGWDDTVTDTGSFDLDSGVESAPAAKVTGKFNFTMPTSHDCTGGVTVPLSVGYTGTVTFSVDLHNDGTADFGPFSIPVTGSGTGTLLCTGGSAPNSLTFATSVTVSGVLSNINLDGISPLDKLSFSGVATLVATAGWTAQDVIVWTGWTHDVKGNVVVNIDSDTDNEWVVPVTGSNTTLPPNIADAAPGTKQTIADQAVDVSGSIRVDDTSSLSVSISNIRLLAGTTLGDVSISGSDKVSVDIGDDGGIDITKTIPLSGSGNIAFTLNPVTNTWTALFSIPVTGSITGVDLDNDGSSDDNATHQGTVTLSASGTWNPATLTLTFTSYSLTHTGTTFIDLNGDGSIEWPKDTSGSTTTLPDPIVLAAETVNDLPATFVFVLSIDGEITDPSGRFEGTLSTPLVTPNPATVFMGGIDFDNDGKVEDNTAEEFTKFSAVGDLVCPSFFPTGGPTTALLCQMNLNFDAQLAGEEFSGTFAGGTIQIIPPNINIALVGSSSWNAANNEVDLTVVLAQLSGQFNWKDLTVNVVKPGTIDDTLDVAPGSGSVGFTGIPRADAATGFTEAELFSMNRGPLPTLDGITVEFTKDTVNPTGPDSFGPTDVALLQLSDGVLSLGPIPNLKLVAAGFSSSHSMVALTLQDADFPAKIYKGDIVSEEWFARGAKGNLSVSVKQLKIGPITVPGILTLQSFVVPLEDALQDDEYDKMIFGGYDDFALTGTGMVYITAWVHDIGFKVVDNLGNPLPAANTAVTLTRGNGPPITRGAGSAPDQFQGNLQWSYNNFGEGWAVFFQLPGEYAYGVTVTFDGGVVYNNPAEIEKLVETPLITLVTQVFKVKLVFVDCAVEPVSNPYVWLIHPTFGSYKTLVDPHGALDLGYMVGGNLTVKGLYWKGVWVPFESASLGDKQLPLNPDGSLTVTIDQNIDSPITLKAVINNFIIYTWDYNKDIQIPRLNVTMQWVGVHPLTGKKLWFMETLDPTLDENPEDFNTTFNSQFLRYKIEYVDEKLNDTNGIRFYSVKYTFFDMPPTYYNFTVTTITSKSDDLDTPSGSKWPGITDKEVNYEVKIDWTPYDPWSVRTSPKEDVNDRVVLRVFGTMNGVPVTDPDLNPGGVGNQTALTCGPRNIDLITWAHNFYKRVIDGDNNYLTEALRIGNATFHVINDNFGHSSFGVQPMEHYDEVNGVWTQEHTSKWDKDLFDISRIKSTSEWSSTIWWNGSYVAHELDFWDYVWPWYEGRPERFAKEYEAGVLTTEKKDPNDPEVFRVNEWFNLTTPQWANAKWPEWNLTVVGNEALWNQQKWVWEQAVASHLVPDVPRVGYNLVYEKQVLPLPIPVGFINIRLKDEDGARPIPYAVVQLDIYSVGGRVDVSSVCNPDLVRTRAAEAAAAALQAANNFANPSGAASITSDERNVLQNDIFAYLEDGVISVAEAEALNNTISSMTDGNFPNLLPSTRVADIATIIQFIYVNLRCDDDTAGYLDSTELNDLATIVDTEVAAGAGSAVRSAVSGTTAVETTVTTTPVANRFAGYKYKTGRDGNLTLLYPTELMLQNILDNNLVNLTMTVYWYQNSTIVYKDTVPLTKKGYWVTNVGIADVTFVHAISADRNRPVKELYAAIWWFNVSDPRTDWHNYVFPGELTVDHTKRTWKYTEIPETRGQKAWSTGQLTLKYVPVAERYKRLDWRVVWDSEAGQWVYKQFDVSKDIPYPANPDGSIQAGWPYQPKPAGYVRALHYWEAYEITYRVSIWHPSLKIDPSLPSYPFGAWSQGFVAPDTVTPSGDLYELTWTPLSAGDLTPPVFRFPWLIFGNVTDNRNDVDGKTYISWYRGPDGVGDFKPIPGYALTKTTWATPGPGQKIVAIKLNATDVEIPVFWQVGDYELGTYDCGPLEGYIIKGKIVPPKGSTLAPIVVDSTKAPWVTGVAEHVTCSALKQGGKVWLATYKSGNTVPTVVWGSSPLLRAFGGASKIVIDEVSPPPAIWRNDGEGGHNDGLGTTSDYWKNWVQKAVDPVTGNPVKLTVDKQIQVPGADLGIQYMGYGIPYEGVAREHAIIALSNDPATRVHRPFVFVFEFQNVTARITDFNGRALPGAFYQIIDASTQKSAAWSYAGPDGRVIPMPIRKPGGVFIQRVTYLGIGANGEPTWPVNSFTKWPVAYDSREDETTQETQKPDIPIGFTYTVEAGPWPVGSGWRQDVWTLPDDISSKVCKDLPGNFMYFYDSDLLVTLASCPPAGWGRTFDVITRIFDLRIRFVYGPAQKPADPDFVFSSPSLALPDQFSIKGKAEVFEAKRLARGTYEVTAYWPSPPPSGIPVGTRTFDVSRVNVGTVEGTVVLSLTDVAVEFRDEEGRQLTGAQVSFSPNLVRSGDAVPRPDGVYTVLRVPTGVIYTFEASWTSPLGKTAKASVRDSASGLVERGVIVLPVADVQVSVVDFDGRAVGGASIRFEGQDVGVTDTEGRIIISQVPLDNDYRITVIKEGTTLGEETRRFTGGIRQATITAGIYDIVVLVKGAAGQAIQGATVNLIKGGATVATAATNEAGTVVFPKMIGADYDVRAEFAPFTASKALPKGTKSATLTIDLYTFVLGVPMTFATFLALIIGLILLVIVVVVIVSEYVRWRGRRLGIYPAVPPKK